MQKKLLRIEPDGQAAEAHTLLGRTDYVWAKGSLLQELNYDADGGRTQSRSYLYEETGDYLPLGHRDDDGPWRYYFTDPNGTPEEIVDADGNVLGTLKRSAYGRTEQVDGSKETTQIRFPGQYEDAETGLHYNRYRYYDPDTGRYLSPDPIGIEGGHDLFVYGPNPIGFYDPMGWEHYMRVKTATGSDGQPLLDDNNENLAGQLFKSQISDETPETLRNRALCHTERQLLYGLGAKGNVGRLDGAKVELEGEYPPCPNCHRAMHNFAKENGTELSYEWEKDGKTQKITYPVPDDPAVPNTTGDDAKRLQDVYRLSEREDGREITQNYKFDEHKQASQEYGKQRDEIMVAQNEPNADRPNKVDYEEQQRKKGQQ
jgi:RHS repeat-associated protein